MSEGTVDAPQGPSEEAKALSEDMRKRIEVRIADIEMRRDGGGTTMVDEWYRADVKALLASQRAPREITPRDMAEALGSRFDLGDKTIGDLVDTLNERLRAPTPDAA